jgi:hypothetical protein
MLLREQRTIFTPMRHRLVLGRSLLPSSPFSAYRVFVNSLRTSDKARELGWIV